MNDLPKRREEALVVRAEALPAFESLVARGFTIAQHQGFTPRVRADRDFGSWHAGIDFWMSLDENGKYRPEWNREMPFDLDASAAVDREENSELVRYWLPHSFYSLRPYPEALASLREDLAALATIIEGWSEEMILRTGSRNVIKR